MRTSFNEYLKAKEFAHKSIDSAEKSVKRFIRWTVKENVQLEQVRYHDLLLWMKHCQQGGASQKTIQNYVLMVKIYYDHLIEQKEITINPANGIKVQGVKRKILYHILQPHELHALYNNYPHNTLAEKRDKIMLGLLVYQGLKTEELGKLEVKDVKLKAGQIEIHGSRKSNARTLQLEAHQIMDVYEYVNQTRKEILKRSKEQTEKLLVALRPCKFFNNLMQELLLKLQKQNKTVKNAKQLRASVIVKWLRQHNLRQVQYLAGHRYISSTEAYQQNEMEGLTEEVNKFHPLG
jgi:site-specific recombinase XerD